MASKKHLPSCSATPAAKPAAAPTSATSASWRWPWETGATLGGTAALLLAGWWLIGPEAARLLGQVLGLLGRGLGAVLRPVRAQWERFARWIAETSDRAEAREREGHLALVAEQIAASAAQAQGQAEAEQRRSQHEQAEFERFWERIEKEDAK